MAERTIPFAEAAADAIRYWEWRRIAYNAVLAAVVLGHFLAGRWMSRDFFSWDTLLRLVVLAALANVCYCAAYAVDLFVQYSALRAAWRRRRWVLFVLGTAVAAVVAHFFVLALFWQEVPA